MLFSVSTPRARVLIPCACVNVYIYLCTLICVYYIFTRWWKYWDQKWEAGIQSPIQDRLSWQHWPCSWRWTEKGKNISAILESINTGWLSSLILCQFFLSHSRSFIVQLKLSALEKQFSLWTNLKAAWVADPLQIQYVCLMIWVLLVVGETVGFISLLSTNRIKILKPTIILVCLSDPSLFLSTEAINLTHIV